MEERKDEKNGDFQNNNVSLEETQESERMVEVLEIGRALENIRIEEDESNALDAKFPLDLTALEGIDKRTKVVRELYTSEQIYVNNLTAMIEV